MGFLRCPRSSWASKLDAHPLSFLLSFHTLRALVHPLHGNPYSLTLISIDGHLHSPLIRLVDVRPSSSLLSSPQPPLFSTYSAMSMAHAHVLRESWKSLRILKYETIAWPIPGLCMIEIFCVMKMEHSQTIWFCRHNFLWPCYFEKTWLLWLVCLKYYYFLCQYELLSWIFRIWIFISQLRRLTMKLCQSITPH